MMREHGGVLLVSSGKYEHGVRHGLHNAGFDFPLRRSGQSEVEPAGADGPAERYASTPRPRRSGGGGQGPTLGKGGRKGSRCSEEIDRNKQVLSSFGVTGCSKGRPRRSEIWDLFHEGRHLLLDCGLAVKCRDYPEDGENNKLWIFIFNPLMETKLKASAPPALAPRSNGADGFQMWS